MIEIYEERIAHWQYMAEMAEKNGRPEQAEACREKAKAWEKHLLDETERVGE